jgi:cytosine/adenosine deaminase-related metal-dependent hydrolase
VEYAQRLFSRSRNVLAAEEGASIGAALYKGALAGGAQALAAGAAALEPGASADIVCLDSDHPSLAGRHGDACLDSYIFAGAPISTVWRAGEQVVAGGRHKNGDAIAARYRATLNRLLEN